MAVPGFRTKLIDRLLSRWMKFWYKKEITGTLTVLPNIFHLCEIGLFDCGDQSPQ